MRVVGSGRGVRGDFPRQRDPREAIMAVTAPYRTSGDPLDRFFDTVLGAGGARGGSLMRAPETDVVETEREIRVATEMPGLRQEDIEVDVENNVLTIRGEKREERSEGEQGKYHLAERRYGTFARSFVLPRDVDAERIEAAFENGVLTVRIPKSEKTQRRRIQVGGQQGQVEG
nr:Amidohydrolase [uncultured bacterium]